MKRLVKLFFFGMTLFLWTSTASADSLATERVQYFRKAVPDLIITEPIKNLKKGINVYYIQCGVPVCEEIKTGIEGATKALGWKLNIVTHTRILRIQCNRPGRPLPMPTQTWCSPLAIRGNGSKINWLHLTSARFPWWFGLYPKAIVLARDSLQIC